MTPNITFCWCAPRSLSSILEKCIAQSKDDVYTFHEPFSLYYYGQKGVLQHAVSFDQVVAEIREKAKLHKHVFIKELAYCVVNAPEFEKYKSFFINECRHMFLIRSPELTIPSLSAQMKRVYGADISFDKIVEASGILELNDLHLLVTEHWREMAVIIDANELQIDPESTIKSICLYMELPFETSMLTWEKGSLHDWGTWSEKNWHEVAESTTSIVSSSQQEQKRKYKTEWEDDRVRKLIDKLQPAYERLHQHLQRP